jgi:hypothetical protein
LLILPIAVLGVAADRRWNDSQATAWILVGAVGVALAFAIFKGFRGLGARVHSALTHWTKRVASKCRTPFGTRKH